MITRSWHLLAVRMKLPCAQAIACNCMQLHAYAAVVLELDRAPENSKSLTVTVDVASREGMRHECS